MLLVGICVATSGWWNTGPFSECHSTHLFFDGDSLKHVTCFYGLKNDYQLTSLHAVYCAWKCVLYVQYTSFQMYRYTYNIIDNLINTSFVTQIITRFTPHVLKKGLKKLVLLISWESRGHFNFERDLFFKGIPKLRRKQLLDFTLRIQICPQKGISPIVPFWGWDVSTINPTLGKGLDWFLGLGWNSNNCKWMVLVGYWEGFPP